MLIILILVLIIIFTIFIKFNIEKFTVDFQPYKNPYFGFCHPNLSNKQWKSGNFKSHCWNNYAYEDCLLLNNHGFNCGYNLLTGEKLPCIHSTGKCNDIPQCFSTCNDQVGIDDQPYMIDVKSNNLIGLLPA